MGVVLVKDHEWLKLQKLFHIDTVEFFLFCILEFFYLFALVKTSLGEQYKK